MSMNEQFNRQYVETIELVKSRAIWRVGERIQEGEAFRCRCDRCGYESLHQRFDITRHQLLFGKSIRTMEAPRPMVRCRRCGEQRHLRDVGELVVPSTIALYAGVLDAVVAHLASDEHRAAEHRAAELPPHVGALVDALREEASGPVRQQLLREVAAGPDTLRADGSRGVLEALGRALFLSNDQISAAIDEPPAPGSVLPTDDAD